MKHSKIIGAGSYLPAKVVTNGALEKILDNSDKRVRDRTGSCMRSDKYQFGQTLMSGKNWLYKNTALWHEQPPE